MAKTTIPVELSSTPGITDNSNATAITIDSSEDVTFAGAVTSTGKITADAGIDIDNINIDGTTLALSSGDITLDVAGRIDLSADDNGEIRFYDGSSMYAVIKDDDDRLSIEGKIQDKNILFVVNDGGSATTALQIAADNGGQLLAAPLGVANPTYSFSGDSNTGMTRPTGDTLQFVCGGTVKLRVSGDGLLFNSDTAAANALDDYEEGTFTPTFSGATLSTATGSYTKIGNQVTVHYHVVTSGGLPSSGGQVQVGNLPFTSGSSFMGAGQVYVGPSNVSSATGGGGQISTIMEGSATVIRFVNVDTGTLGYTLWGELEVSSNNVVTAIGTFTYTV